MDAVVLRRLAVATPDAGVAILGFPAAGHSAPFEWNLRVPVAAHFGPPFTGFESGLRADLLGTTSNSTFLN